VSSPVDSRPDVGVVIVAAGAGVRAGPGEPKQFRPILGVPMLLRSLRQFTSHPDVAQVVVALPAAFVEHPPQWLGGLLGAGERLKLVTGGHTRSESVRAGMAMLQKHLPIVLVHDAARPFVTRDTVDAVVKCVRGGVAAIAAIPMGDTVKEVGEGTQVLRTVPRGALWRAQTPQGFPRPLLAQAYEQWSGTESPTDDAEVYERAGLPVEVVADSPFNIKVTTADDFRLAEALAREFR